jgi:hypothetical protein
MSRLSKTLDQILRGNSDANIDFNDLRGLLDALMFRERVKGSHHIFTRPGVSEIINLQPMGSKAKSYQVKQVRQLITKYSLGDDNV